MTPRLPYRGLLQAVIFDWAGTTVDYGCFAPVAVFVEIFRRCGVEISAAEARTPMGLEKRDHIRAIAGMPAVAARWGAVHGRACNENDIQALYDNSLDLQTASAAAHADLIPGTHETVANCRARGLKIGSTTGYSRAIMDALLPAAARQGYTPDAVVCPDEVSHGRPAPFMLYQNAIQLQAYPMSAIVKVGDTVPDIEEGLNAGAWTVAVTQTGNELGLSLDEVSALDPSELAARLKAIEARLQQAGVHFVIRSIGDLPPVLDQIAARLQEGHAPSSP